MAARFQAPRGTADTLPAGSARRAQVYATAAGLFERAGYGRIETPAFEDTELFSRGVGEATDIVRKEMFSFLDQGERSLTLRPEGTAPICRAYAQHGMHKLPQPVKLWYWGPYFRHERPQAGRFRQFSQVGAEAIGSDSPLLDAEAIVLLSDLLGELGVPGVRLRLGSLGSSGSRALYRDELRAYLSDHEAELSADVRGRIAQNPMRAFDSDDDGTRAVMAAAPTMLERLDEEDAEHFEAVKRLLDQAGVAYELDPTLVRGLDYYSRTVFEFESAQLGAQAALGGGGRYDGLVEELGGPATAAVGWAAGIERILMAVEQSPTPQGIEVFIVAAESQRERALATATMLRRQGVGADLDLAGRSHKGQMKHADRTRASLAIILTEDGSARLRTMASGEERQLDLSNPIQELERARAGAPARDGR